MDNSAVVDNPVTRTTEETQLPGSSRSLLLSSSMFTSLKVSTRTCLTNRAYRYMSQTHASAIETSKKTSPWTECTCIS